MNNYPIWWDHTLTIYNKYEDPTTNIISWHRHVVPGCFWRYNRDVIKFGDASTETVNIVCRIRKDDKFKERFEWVTLPNEQMDEYFTVGIGDIIIRGEVDDTVDEYAKGHRSTDLISKYKNLQGCMQVEMVSVNTGPGRGNEHYRIEGS